MNALNIVMAKPEQPDSGHCQKHGNFEYRYQQMGGRWLVLSSCQLCAAEANAAQRLMEERQAAAAAQARQDRQRIDAGVSPRYARVKFDDYCVTTPEQAQSLADAMQFVDRLNAGASGSLIMSGRVGTGKTMLASAMINMLLPHKRCRIATLAELVREIKDSWNKGSGVSETALLRRLADLDLLIIDEVGQQRGTETEMLLIFEIIDGRYRNMLPTVLISNLDRAGIREAIGDRAFDRLRQDGGKLVAFNWGSMRAAV